MSDLYTIPVPSDVKLQKEISNLVEFIYNKGTVGNQIDKINNLVYQYFGVDEEEVQIIKEAIESF